MSVEQQLRDHYRTTTDEVLNGPELGSVLDHGRRRRRTRVSGAVGAGAAVLSVGVLLAASVLGNGTDATVSDPNRGVDAAAGTEDFVAGTTVDDAMQAVIAEHLPALGAPQDVYPSDWYHNGPMPDADFADATDWQAAYPVDDDEHVLVFMGYPMPGESNGCGPCDKETVPGGTLMTQVSYLQDPGEWHFLTSLVRDDGFTVGFIDYVQAPELADARDARSISNGDARDVVLDPRMRFPEPENPPTGP